MLVREIMNKNVVSVEPDDPIIQAARLMARHNIGALPVCSGDRTLRGMITDRDIVLRCVASEDDAKNTPVRDIMSRNVITASPEDSIHRARQLMSVRQVRRLPVLENSKLVGMLSLGDMARSHECNMEAAAALSEISTNMLRK